MEGRRTVLRGALAWGLGTAMAVPGRAEVTDTARYRPTGAKHLYDTYRERIFKGKLPPLVYAIAIIDVDLDEHGNVLSAVVSREPASAKEVGPWAVSLIQQASPFPPPGRRAQYREIWLVDRSYKFQLDTLTEGQL